MARQKPERIVIVFRFDDPDSVLAHEYELVATYRLFVSPKYQEDDGHSDTLDTVRHQELVKVHVRRGG